jgi:hypothetical protein
MEYEEFLGFNKRQDFGQVPSREWREGVVDIIFVGSCGIEKFHVNGNINSDKLGVKRESPISKGLSLAYKSSK